MVEEKEELLMSMDSSVRGRWLIALLAGLALAAVISCRAEPTATTPTPAPRDIPEGYDEITGTLVWDGGGSLPAVGYTELVRKPKSGLWSARDGEDTIATAILGEATASGRVPFSIRYDPALIDPNEDYAILARFSNVVVTDPLVGKGKIYSNIDRHGVEPVHVLTKGRPHKDVEVELDVILVII